MRTSWLLLIGGLGLGARDPEFPNPEPRAPNPSQAPRVEVLPNDAQRRVDVLVDGKPFTSYIYPTTLKKPTLYPVRSASGVVVTRGWPLEPRPGERVDHPHQVGLWFDHGDVNGLDFWNNSDAIPPARAARMGTILHRAVRRAEGGTGRYRSSEGLVGDSVWGTRGRWTMLSGTVAGEPMTLAILDHPKNVGFPTYWHARGYGLFAANPLGRKAFTNGKAELNFRLGPREATTFRHRLLILSGSATPEQIETYYRDFTR